MIHRCRIVRDSPIPDRFATRGAPSTSVTVPGHERWSGPSGNEQVSPARRAARPVTMALLPPQPTHLAVRWIHVLAMATLFGGAVLCWGLLRRDDVRRRSPWLRVAATYEWLFWAGAGLVVLTGIGNLGALAPALPAPGTAWGAAFSVKLAGVLALLLGSLVRTVGVVWLLRTPTRPPMAALYRLATGYGATAFLLVGVVAAAEVLAHG